MTRNEKGALVLLAIYLIAIKRKTVPGSKPPAPKSDNAIVPNPLPVGPPIVTVPGAILP